MTTQSPRPTIAYVASADTFGGSFIIVKYENGRMASTRGTFPTMQAARDKAHSLTIIEAQRATNAPEGWE